MAYDFPPYVSVGGLRPFNWYKYFRRMGIEPVVVTRQWSNHYGNHLDYVAPGQSDQVISEETEYGTVLRSPYKPNCANRILLKYGENRYKLFRKMGSAWYEFFQWFFVSGPKAELYRTADDYLKRNKVDAILATGDPFVLFRYASKLSNKHHNQWIADYRDPWSHAWEKGERRWLHRFFTFLEKKHVYSASAITTVSEFLSHKIGQLLPHIPIHVLPNGYDPEAVIPAQKIQPPTDRLRFGFVGTIYEWHPWKSVLRVFEAYRKTHPNIFFEINFYGINIAEQVEQEIHQYAPELWKHVNIYGRMPNDKLLPELGGNHVMLLFNYYSYMGTKIFDYLGLQRQIVMCYAEDEEAIQLKEKYYQIEEVKGISQQLQADLIEETHSGIVVKDALHFFKVLEDLFTEFEKTRTIACYSVGIENYSRVHQVKKLAELIHSFSQ